MKVLNLRCAHEHVFEGWFGSEADFQSQFERGLVECPMCADKAITKLPSAPRLNVSGAKRPVDAQTPSTAVAASAPSPEAVTLQSMWAKAVQHVLANTDDVGERFAEEARRIHYGEVEERAIRGRTTREDAQALHEEGIDVVMLPMPPKDTIQ